jgi:hypothetical protein
MIAGLSSCVDVGVGVEGTCGMQGRSLRQFFFCFHRLWFVCRGPLRSCVNTGAALGDECTTRFDRYKVYV